VTALLECLHKHKFTDAVLQSRWLALGTDGASVMLGRVGGVLAKLQEKFPNILGWHCFNHRLELSVHDVVTSVTDVNHFKTFLDKIYTLYSRSPKAKRQLDACAAELGSQVYKIGRILDVRWASSSLRTVRAVWRSYASCTGISKQHRLTCLMTLLTELCMLDSERNWQTRFS